MARVGVEEAAALLGAGRIVGIPTETVYGLAARLDQPDGVRAIFARKGRPAMNPLIVHVADVEQARCLAAEWSPTADRLAVLWPGPLTLIVAARLDLIPEAVRAGLPTVGIRVPAHPLCRELLQVTGPLVAPSANLSGRPSSSSAAHVEEDFGADFPVLDGGCCMAGVESTIVTAFGAPQIGRLGALSPESIFALTDVRVALPDSTLVEARAESPLCPGQLLKHYAPRARLHLCSKRAPPSDAVILGFGDRHYASVQLWSLGDSNDPEAVAGQLYAQLRRIDREELDEAWIDDRMAEEGLWRTILERMQRAAASA